MLLAEHRRNQALLTQSGFEGPSRRGGTAFYSGGGAGGGGKQRRASLLAKIMGEEGSHHGHLQGAAHSPKAPGGHAPHAVHPVPQATPGRAHLLREEEPHGPPTSPSIDRLLLGQSMAQAQVGGVVVAVGSAVGAAFCSCVA